MNEERLNSISAAFGDAIGKKVSIYRSEGIVSINVVDGTFKFGICQKPYWDELTDEELVDSLVKAFKNFPKEEVKFNLENFNNSKPIFKVFSESAGESKRVLGPIWTFLDLRLVPYLVIDDDGKEQFYIQVTDKMITAGVHVDFEKLKQNTLKYYPAKICRIESLLQEIQHSKLEINFPEISLDAISENDEGMFVVMNVASALLGDTLGCLADKLNSDLTVLPSSVYELLCLKKSEDVQIAELNAMVKAVNETLEPNDVLSDHIYIFKRKERTLCIQ